MPNAPTERPHGRRHAWWLLLTVPIAAVLAYVPFVIAAINVCGISGCSGGGYGVSYGPVGTTIGLNLVIGLLFGTAVALPTWGPHARRLKVGGLIAVAITLALSLPMLAPRFL